MQKISLPDPPLLISVEGYDREAVNASMRENDCRNISKFEFILIDSAILYLSTVLELTNNALTSKRNPEAILLRRLVVKLLLTVTSLTEEGICILLDIDRGNLHDIKNRILPNMEFDVDFTAKYSSLLNHVIREKELVLGNSETHHNRVLTTRIHDLITRANS